LGGSGPENRPSWLAERIARELTAAFFGAANRVAAY
jgi:hypothetical protein